MTLPGSPSTGLPMSPCYRRFINPTREPNKLIIVTSSSPLFLFFFPVSFQFRRLGDESLAAESEAVQRVRMIVEDAGRPRKSCVSTAVSSRLDLGPRASDDTRNNDRSSWQLPSRRLVTQPPTQPSLSAELSFSSRTAEPVVQPRN
ncbi:hypothetical protein EAG_02142 [Camponotus floridanus]|uniref:Uncharacterized protein n=1 Tax=Camponotus floridanus TaxID=104421 RepID=E2B1S2_CAMFO|nr:hypothetical protein EAG_02142 [Camponotus floridanus]